jgi:hypothetical protein
MALVLRGERIVATATELQRIPSERNCLLDQEAELSVSH